MISTAVRVARLQPPSALFAVSSPSSVHRSTGVATFCLRAQMEGHPTEKADDQKPSAVEEVTGDVMWESFGERYATRSDDEGFGGIYGGNVGPVKPTHTDFDKSGEGERESKHQTSAQVEVPLDSLPVAKE